MRPLNCHHMRLLDREQFTLAMMEMFEELLSEADVDTK